MLALLSRAARPLAAAGLLSVLAALLLSASAHAAARAAGHAGRAPHLAARLVGRDTNRILRERTVRVRLGGPAGVHMRVILTLSGTGTRRAGRSALAAGIPSTRPVNVTIGRGGRRGAALRLTSAGRRELRAGLTGCRPVLVTIHLLGKGLHVHRHDRLGRARSCRPATTPPGAGSGSRLLANLCYAIASSAGRFVAASGSDAYSASAATIAGGAAFYLKPTGIGTYMLYDQEGKLLSVQDPFGGAAGQAAGAGNGVGGGSGTVGRSDTPGKPAEWAVGEAPGQTYTITSTVRGQQLAVAPDGTLIITAAGAAGRQGLFSFVSDRGCRPFPEAEVGAVGQPFAAMDGHGPVLGFADVHMHLTADLRAGGRVIYGESFDPFGVTLALGSDGDQAAHGPNGTLDFTGNLIRGGSPAGTHDTHGWPTFAGWPVHNTITHQQIYWVWLQRAWMAGLRLIVAQTVEDTELCRIEPVTSHSCDETESIRLQVARLQGLQDYVDAQYGGPGRGWFRLVYDPQQARSVIKEGKLAVIIGVESSNPFGCSEYQDQPQCTQADIDRGLSEFHRLGVRSFFIAHWVDNAFAGAAFEPGAQGTLINAMNKLQTGHYFRAERCSQPGEGETMISPGHAFDGSDPISTALNGAQSTAAPTYPSGPLCNAKGLTSLGEYLARRMISEHFMIEMDHLSEKARASVLAMAQTSHYPVVSSHTGTGGIWLPAQLARLYALGGIAAAHADSVPKVVDRILELRRSRSASFYFGVPFGTDTGGFGGLAGPLIDAGKRLLRYPFRSYDGRVSFVRQRTGERSFDLNTDGIAHYGLMADLVADLQQQPGAGDALPALFHSAEAYLETWQRATGHR
jgi:microsomal dipeptidase-like Zn-dependent dipeptidase